MVIPARFNRTRWVHVFFGAKNREDLYDLDDLNKLAARYPWLSVVPACSRDKTYPGEKGTVAQVVRRYGPWQEHEILVQEALPAWRPRRPAGTRLPTAMREVAGALGTYTSSLADSPYQIALDPHQAVALQHDV